MTDREKLIALYNRLEDDGLLCTAGKADMADLMIANGVTFAKDINVPGWIPVTERLPKKEGWYQVFTSPDKGHKSINKACYSLEPEWSVNAGKGRWNGSGGTWTNVTHWMPLPEPPKEVE